MPPDAATAESPAATAELYGPAYYASHCGPVPYERNDHWLRFFGGVADELIRAFAPRRAFDAGCALGMLVECLWERGVEAHGRDISAFAIESVRADVAPFCTVGSIADPILGDYDVLTCIEVLEHMPEEAALAAIAAMAGAAPRILFSSSPTDFDEPTHCNVRPSAYWLARWAEAGFAPLAIYDAGYLAPHAYVLERSETGRTPRDLAIFADRIRYRVRLAEMGAEVAGLAAELVTTTAAAEAAIAGRDQHRETLDELAPKAASLAAELDAASRSISETKAEAEAALAERDALRAGLDAASRSFAETKAEAEAALAERDALRARLTRQEIEDRRLRAASAQRAAEARQEAEAMRAQAGVAASEAARLREQLTRHGVAAPAEIPAERRPGAADLARAEAALRRMTAERDRVVMSTVWRATWPLRAAGSLLPRPAKSLVRRSLSLGWWTVKGQLGAKLAQRRAILNDTASVAASPLFDEAWYRSRHSDVEASGLDPALHYATIGGKEGRDPGPRFSAAAYAARHPEAAKALRPALLHFMETGASDADVVPVPQSAPPRPSLPGPAGAPLRGEDPYEVVAREIFEEQQADLSREAAAQAVAGFAHRPLISVLMPVYKTPVQWLRRAVESLQEQYYGDWELCAVDDQSPGSEQRDALGALAATDPRVRLAVMERNGGISAATNLALRMAQGEYIALLDHDDELTPDALFRMVEAISRQPEADFIYSDECKIDDTPARRLFHFVFKPAWSPEIMFNGMLTGHLTAYRRTLVEQLGGFRSEYDFSQDYDLVLRVAEVAKCVVHVERVLYLWRAIPGSAATGAKFDARAGNIAALNAALQRRNIPGEATPLSFANWVRIAVPASETLVSIIIPSDSWQNLRPALQAIRTDTDYPNYEVVVVCNGPLAARLADEFSDWDALTFAPYNKPYNFSDKCNEGARAAAGDVLVFYNDDVFPLQRDWVERLIEYLWVDGVGGVSPKLLHADDTIQYAGMISGTPGLCGTPYNNVACDTPDSFLTMHKYVRNVSILSGACCALRKDVFWRVGAFDADNTPDAHSDLDLSYKLMEAGLRCVYTPHALLRHIGNHSWGAKRRKDRADAFMLQRWGRYVSTDQFFTASMKRVLYRDFAFFFRIHAEHLDPARRPPGPHVLFVSHELSLTGAPRMLLYAAKVVLEAGGFPVIAAREDGPLRQEITEAGITTIIDASLGQSHFLFARFARNFDLAVVNTIALSAVVRQLSTIENLRTVWWLHEAQSLAKDLPSVDGVRWACVQVLCNGAYAHGFVPDGIKAEILHYGIPDDASRKEQQPASGTITFLLSGTIEPRKGQDVLVEAVALLPEHVRRDCRFLMTGTLWEMHHEFWREVEGKMAGLPEITYLGLREHQEQIRLIAGSDVVVCASRDEPWSLVVMEAAMLQKPSILNENVGAGEMFDEASCFRFECGSPSSLAGQLLAAYERRDELPAIGRAARQVFERELTLDAFGARFLAIVERHVASDIPHGRPAIRRDRAEMSNSEFDSAVLN